MDHTKMKHNHFMIEYNGYQDRIIQSLRYFQSRNEFLDVTLICENHTFTVLKIILTSLSPYFYQKLKDETSPHPTILLEDVSYTIMQKILVFLYSGNIQVEKSELDDFIKAATLFEIIGATTKSVQSISGDNLPKIEGSNNARELKRKKRTRKPKTPKPKESIKAGHQYSLRNRDSKEESTVQMNVTCLFCSRKYDSVEDVKEHLKFKHDKSAEKEFEIYCTQCDRKYSYRRSMGNNRCHGHRNINKNISRARKILFK